MGEPEQSAPDRSVHGSSASAHGGVLDIAEKFNIIASWGMADSERERAAALAL